MEQHFVEEPCQEGWHRPVLSLFAKVFTVLSCKLPKVTCFQKFTFAKRSANASLPHGRQNRLIIPPVKKNRKFPIEQSPFQCFHRIFPPNSVPPSSRFNTSRTAKRPNTKAPAIMTASKMIRFEVIVIKTSLTFWWDECIIKTALSQSSQPK